MTKNFRLPSDILKLIRKRIIKKVILFLLLEAVSVLGFIYLSNNSSLSENIVTYFVVLLILVIYPIFVAKLPSIIKDRPYRGEVVSVRVTDEMGVYTKSLKNILYYPKQSIVLSIKLANGKTKDVKVRSVGQRTHVGFEVPSEGKIEDHIKDYSVGDTVYHFPTLDQPLIIKKEPTDFSLCVVCGTKNSAERDTCLNCNHTIVRT